MTHYGQVLKKYKRVRAILHRASVTAGSFVTSLSSAGVGVSVTGVGVLVCGPLVALAGSLGLIGVTAGLLSRPQR